MRIDHQRIYRLSIVLGISVILGSCSSTQEKNHESFAPKNSKDHIANITGSKELDTNSGLWRTFQSVVSLELEKNVNPKDVRGSYDAACNGVFIGERLMLTSTTCFLFMSFSVNNFDSELYLPFLLNGQVIHKEDIDRAFIVTSTKSKTASVKGFIFSQVGWKKIKPLVGNKYFKLYTKPVHVGEKVMLAGWGNNSARGQRQRDHGYGTLRYGFNRVKSAGPLIFFPGTDEPEAIDFPVFSKTALGDRGASLFYAEDAVDSSYNLKKVPSLIGIAWWDSATLQDLGSGSSFVHIDQEMADEIWGMYRRFVSFP